MAVNGAAALFLAFLIVQRLSELVIARRNTRRLLDEGAREVGAAHYKWMVALHTAWVTALVLFGLGEPVRLDWLAVFVALQLARVWILATLGGRWTTRILILERPPVVAGPFRLLRHPNYWLVTAEIVVAPLVLGLTGVALLFAVLNGWMLIVRVSEEEAALAPLREQDRRGD